MTILRYSESPAVGVDFGSINSTTGKPFLLNHLRGESVSYDVSISTPIGGYGLNYGGKLYNVDYGHFKSTSVQIGQIVKAGTTLGQIGWVGNILSMSAKYYPTHLHVSVWRDVNGNRGFVKPWW